MAKIAHIVLFKFTRPSHLSSAELDAHLELAQKTVSRLPAETSGWETASVGPPAIKGREQGYEFGFYSVFASREALDTYTVSEAHQNVVKDIAKIKQEVLAYDWEL